MKNCPPLIGRNAALRSAPPQRAAKPIIMQNMRPRICYQIRWRANMSFHNLFASIDLLKINCSIGEYEADRKCPTWISNPMHPSILNNKITQIWNHLIWNAKGWTLFGRNSTLRGASYTANPFSGWFALLFSNDQHWGLLTRTVRELPFCMPLISN